MESVFLISFNNYHRRNPYFLINFFISSDKEGYRVLISKYNLFNEVLCFHNFIIASIFLQEDDNNEKETLFDDCLSHATAIGACPRKGQRLHHQHARGIEKLELLWLSQEEAGMPLKRLSTTMSWLAPYMATITVSFLPTSSLPTRPAINSMTWWQVRPILTAFSLTA